MKAENQNTITSQQEAAEEKERKEIWKKAHENSDEFAKDLKKNKQGGRTVYSYNGAWVVRPHSHTRKITVR